MNDKNKGPLDRPTSVPARPVAATSAKSKAVEPPPPAEAGPVAPLYRQVDWLAFGITTLMVLIGYCYTLAPNLGLEDSGELAVGSLYAGVPHPPGYPVWTIFTWLFTVLVPISNVAWRVALSSAVSGAVSCGLIALMVSRGSSMMIESIEDFKNFPRKWENAICLVAGYVAGMLVAFNGYVWSQCIIVEVYAFSLLSWVAVLACMLRWIYATHQRIYLYLAMFLFGVCFTNHQTLVTAAMGLQLLVVFAHPAVGRDFLLGNSIIFMTGLLLKQAGMLTGFNTNPPLFHIFLVIGLGSMAAFGWLFYQTGKVLTEWKSAILCAICWLLGAAFYFYMPLASMTNPPMNWGYPRTLDGFIHALTRGQYEQAHPSNDFIRYLGQVKDYFVGAAEEFNAVYLALGVFPFIYFALMKRRERAWLVGLLGTYSCLAFLLVFLLNPNSDRQSQELNRVFFTFSHAVLAMFVGYGLSLIAVSLATHYQRYRAYAIAGSAMAVAAAAYAYADNEFKDSLTAFTALFGLGLAVFSMVVFVVFKVQLWMPALLGIYVVMPFHSILSHWFENEQRGHLYGYWFGHDMFTPPFGVYPEMTRNAVLFGGTDPGRFCPTYMIFCESFIPPSKKMDTDPKFDRRDVYIITQNALADHTYLSYIRAHYNRSTQIDPPFFQELLRGADERSKGTYTNFWARLVRPLDRVFTSLGARIEAQRRKEGVYPAKEIHTPTPADSDRCFQVYMADAQQRLQAGTLRPGEDVKISDGKVQVSGQAAVMAINGLLTKVIFDKNPDHEFFVEESFPLDWMYPYLSPFGVIMKINRQPLPAITQEMVDKDHRFWTQYSERLIGNWIDYSTPMSNVCAFATRMYKNRDYTGYKGPMSFIRDDQAQKAFSKLRSSIAGIYAWRVQQAKPGSEDYHRMFKEAEFALKQAFAFCAFSPEAVYRFVNLVTGAGRIDDAILVATTAQTLDPNNGAYRDLLRQLHQIKSGTPNIAQYANTPQIQAQLNKLESDYASQPTSPKAAMDVFYAYLQLQQTNKAVQVADRMLMDTNSSRDLLLAAATCYSQVLDVPKLEITLGRLVKLMPDSPEVWYDLAAVQVMSGKSQAGMESLKSAVRVNGERLKTSIGSNNILNVLSNDARFNPLRSLPEFQLILSGKSG